MLIPYVQEVLVFHQLNKMWILLTIIIILLFVFYLSLEWWLKIKINKLRRNYNENDDKSRRTGEGDPRRNSSSTENTDGLEVSIKECPISEPNPTGNGKPREYRPLPTSTDIISIEDKRESGKDSEVPRK